MPEVHMDYCFLRNKEGEEALPVIVLKDRDSRALAAHGVPYKGRGRRVDRAAVLPGHAEVGYPRGT